MSNIMPKMCSTCLSRDRVLVLLNKYDKYVSLLGSDLTMESLPVCWECEAMLHKLHRFKLQALNAQDMLNKASGQITNAYTRLGFSRLQIHDICCDTALESSTVKDFTIKSDIEIKTEKYIDEEDTVLKHPKIYSTVDDLKNDVITPDVQDFTVIKQEEEEDDIDDKYMDDISISSIELKPKHKKRKTETQKVKKKLKKAGPAKDVAKHSVTKDNYIVIEMTEQEMEENRDIERQTDRYRSLVKFRCELCIMGFFHKELFEKHLRIRHSEAAGIYKCSICETRFPMESAYRDHVSSHYRKYQCRLCQFVGRKLTEMAAHDAKEHGVKRFACKICNEEFPLRSRLRFHRETSHEAPVKCESCPKSFRTRDSLRIHVKQMHSYRHLSSCGECGARVRNIKVHMRVHSAPPEGAYCAECDKRFTSTASYRSHLKYAGRHRPHDLVLSHACSSCDARFVTRAGLRKHELRRHTNVRAHKCDLCGKGFEERCKLRQHIRHVHEGVEKPRDKICHICGRGFTTKLTLSNHIRVHTGEKPFRCDVCGACFSQKSSLTTHTRGVHLKIKPRPGRAKTQ